MKLFPSLRMPLVFVTLGAMSASGRAEPPPAVAIPDTYHLLPRRQKWIELRCFSDYQGTPGDPVHDPDDIPITIVQQPNHGDLIWITGATYLYVPDTVPEVFVGEDCLEFHAAWTWLNTAEVKLLVDEEFVPPLGLGEPAFGIEENASDYTPVRTIPVDLTNGGTIPLTLEAGDHVELEGEQDEPDGQLQITAMGTSINPIFIRGAGPLQRAKLRQGLLIRGRYVIVENIDFDASMDPVIPPNTALNGAWFRVLENTEFPLTSSHIAIRHCSFLNHQSGTAGVAAMVFGAGHTPPVPEIEPTGENASAATTSSEAMPLVGRQVNDCVAYDNLVAHFGDWTGQSGAADYYACGAEGNSNNIWVLDSVFHHMEGGGAGLSRNNAESYHAPAREGFIGRNVIHHVREHGISVKMARNSILTQNVIYRVRPSTTTSHGAGIYIGNNDHCNLDVNMTLWFYSDNVWAIFNDIYDVQTGVSIEQHIHCDGGIGCCPNAKHDDSDTLCCPAEAECYQGPKYRPSAMYVVGNVFHHIFPFCNPADCEPPDPPCCHPPCCARSDYGQAVLVGPQAQVRVVNNTMYKCAQGLQITCTHDSSNPHQCPPYTDPENLTRNTSVTMVNNVILDTPDDGDNDSQVRVCTGPPTAPVFTLTEDVLDGPPGFGHNLHYGTYRTFRIQSGPWDSVEELQADLLTDYGVASLGDEAAHNPNLVNPAQLLFDLGPLSPGFMLTQGVRDAAYDTFESEFPTFPNIYHDYDGHPYPVNPENTCPIGAFGD